MTYLKYFILLAYLILSVETVYAAKTYDCSAALAKCHEIMTGYNAARQTQGIGGCTDTCFNWSGSAVSLNGSVGETCTADSLTGALGQLPPCVATDNCPAGMPVGADSNDYALMTTGSGYNGSYNGCMVSCSGTDSMVPLGCGASPKRAVKGCVYTGDEGTTNPFQQATQPAPEDCDGPLTTNWTKAVSGTSRIRGCACNMWDVTGEFVDRCGWQMADSVWDAVRITASTATAGASVGALPGAATGAAYGAVTSAAKAALDLYASNCLADPVNPSATNVVNCPYQRVGNECTVPRDFVAENECPPGTFQAWGGSQMCITEAQATVTRDQHSETNQTQRDPPAQSNQPSCPSGTAPYKGVCWCESGRIYTLKYGCDGNGGGGGSPAPPKPDPSDPPPDNTTNPDNQGGTGYHVWVDNQSEVYSVLNAIKEKMCGWDAKPCQVHTDNGSGGYTHDRVVVENFQELLDAVNAVDGRVESIRVSANKTEENTTVIKTDIDWIKKDVSIIKTAASDTQNNTSISKDYLFEAKEDINALLSNSHDSLRLDINSNYQLDRANTQLGNVDTKLQDISQKLQPLSGKLDKLDKLNRLDDILEELKKDKTCTVACCNIPDVPPEEETKCVDTTPKDGICDVMHDLTEDIKKALECTDKDNDKVCDVLKEKTESDQPPEEPPEIDVPSYTAGGAGTCPVINISYTLLAGHTHSIHADYSNSLCKGFTFMGYFILMLAYFRAARIYYGVVVSGLAV